MISFYRLPKRDDYNGRHGYRGTEVRYEVERRGKFGYLIQVFRHDGTVSEAHPFEYGAAESLVEAKVWVQAYEESSLRLGSPERYQEAADAGFGAWNKAFKDNKAKYDQKMSAVRAEFGI